MYVDVIFSIKTWKVRPQGYKTLSVLNSKLKLKTTKLTSVSLSYFNKIKVKKKC